jgi:predicted ATPase
MMYGGDPRALGAVMDVAVWLRSLGLERYEAAFRENEITEKVLPSLTAEDLKEIGVGPVGHRQAEEVIALAEQKGTVFWNALGMLGQGSALALTGKGSEAAPVITAGLTALQATGAATFVPWHLTYLARAYMSAGQFADAWRCIREALAAMENTRDKWFEAEVHRMTGELALASPEPDAVKAQAQFEQALDVARHQQAKSWELRAAMSLARLWRDQGKVSEARELLAPVYGWFTEGFDTRDLKEAKALLEQLAQMGVLNSAAFS